MKNLEIFKSEEFGEITVIVENNKEYIEAVKVAKILGYSNPRKAILDNCKYPGVTASDVGVVTGKRADGSEIFQTVTKKFIDEGNLYRLIIKSKLPSAQKFERWIFDEVLPSIRKNGAYMNDEVIIKSLEDPDYIIRLVTKLKEEKQRTKLANERAKELEATILLDKPYINFAKSIAASSDAISMGEFAKLLNNNGIEIGRNRLLRWLRDNGYLIKNGKEKNNPKQVYIEQGLLQLIERTYKTIDKDMISTTTLVTGKGQMYFLEKISKYYAN